MWLKNPAIQEDFDFTESTPAKDEPQYLRRPQNNFSQVPPNNILSQAARWRVQQQCG